MVESKVSPETAWATALTAQSYPASGRDAPLAIASPGRRTGVSGQINKVDYVTVHLNRESLTIAP